MKKAKPYIIQNEDKTAQNMINEAACSYYESEKSEDQLHQMSKKGITKSYLDVTASKLGLSMYEFAPLLHISSRTLLRCVPTDHMDTPVSEHVLLLENLIKNGQEVFGNLENMQSWLHTKIRALDFEKPIQLLDTVFGIQIINNILGRIKYGVYS